MIIQSYNFFVLLTTNFIFFAEFLPQFSALSKDKEEDNDDY